jgi:hypothetical protein
VDGYAPSQSPEPAARITEEKWHFHAGLFRMHFHAGLFRMDDRPIIDVDNL